MKLRRGKQMTWKRKIKKAAVNLGKDPSERAKIASLLSKDKKQDDISWMYSKTKDDPEAYLLGKEVKSLDQVDEITKDYEESPSQRLARIDMEAKFREDPLTLMKQREAEKRMELLKNTAKVKKLRRLLTEQKLRKERRSKEKRRRHRSRSSSSSSSSSSGDELLDKFIKIVRQSDEQNTEQKEQRLNPSRSPPRETSQKPQPKETKHQNKPSTSQRNSAYQERPRLSKEELEARRAQMMADAKEHERERSSRSSQHYHQKKIEEENERLSKKNHGPSFISNMKVKHVDQISIEEGIQRKANSRQKGELGSNFLSR